MARFQILCLIGGGIRGAFVTSLLKGLEQRLGRSVHCQRTVVYAKPYAGRGSNLALSVPVRVLEFGCSRPRRSRPAESG